MLKHKLALTIALVCILLVPDRNGGMSGTADALEVGVATVDITPPLGMPMRGYASRKELSNGVWDPLYVKSIVLDDGNERISLVVLDLIGPPPKDMRERILQKAKEELQVLLFFSWQFIHMLGPI